MKRATLVLLCVGAVILASGGRAEASMIGDLLTVTRFYPDLSTVFTPPPDAIAGQVVVTAQVGPDSTQASPQPDHYSIELEANTILFDFGPIESSFVGAPGPAYNLGNPFDGLRFAGFSDTIQSVTGIAAGITIVEVFHDGNAIFLNLNGAYEDTATLLLTVNFEPNAVPEPSTLVLLGMALGACHIGRRRLNAA